MATRTFKSKVFKLRVDLEDYVNENNDYIYIITISIMDSGFIVWYWED